MRRNCAPFLLLALATFAAPVVAQESVRTETMQFARGASSATIRGNIRGYDAVDYRIGARAGQTLTVSMRVDNKSAYFNVLPPRSPTALFNGSISGNRYSGRLTESGDFRVRVYLMRNAARRGERASFSLTVGVTGAGNRPIGPGGPGPGSGAIGSGPPISPGNMSAFCRGEASSQYGVRPQYIRTRRVASAPGGGNMIDGTADQGRQGIKRFRCRFDARGRFIDVMAISRDGF